MGTRTVVLSIVCCTWYLSPSRLWVTGTSTPSMSAYSALGFSPLVQASENSAMKGMAVRTYRINIDQKF